MVIALLVLLLIRLSVALPYIIPPSRIVYLGKTSNGVRNCSIPAMFHQCKGKLARWGEQDKTF
jgi:hypothetical protein